MKDYLGSEVSSYPERYFLLKLEEGDQVLGFVLAVFINFNSIILFLFWTSPSRKVKGGGDFFLLSHFFTCLKGTERLIY